MIVVEIAKGGNQIASAQESLCLNWTCRFLLRSNMPNLG
jgi:hypothetical protein